MKQEAKRKVLIVDDNPSSLQVFIAYLKKCPDCSFRTACSGLEALHEAKQDCFDLIHMDIDMPNLDGLETIRKLRLIPEYQNVPIIVVSATNVLIGHRESVAAGADDFISLPVGRQEYLDKVNYYLNKSRLSD